MKKIFTLFCFIFIIPLVFAQELFANVTINTDKMPGSNQQVYKTLEKNIRDFINTTSWTGKKLENFEKIKCNFAIIISGRESNRFNGTLVVQSVRPVYGSLYESPILNINDTKFNFEYIENENLIFNERQFSGKNLTDVISYYVYLILAYDADSFQSKGGSPWFAKALKISQNSQNRGFDGWSQVDGPKSRASFIDDIVNPNLGTFRNISYSYHRSGLDNMFNTDQTQAKKIIFDALMNLKPYENTFQQNYPITLFLDAKANEIFNIFDSTNNGSVNMGELKQLMTTFAPKYIESKWSKWK